MKTDKIRRVAHGQVWFSNPEPILELCQLQCSATRSAYQAIHKHSLKGNDVKKYVKKNYMQTLNQRYVADAFSIASGINQDNSIFGGKRAWKLMNNGVISKEEWKNRRNYSLYSRGDRTKNGNPNVRIEDNVLKVNMPTERGKWIKGKLHIPKKFDLNLECYDVRLKYVADGKFKVMLTWEEERPKEKTNKTGKKEKSDKDNLNLEGRGLSIDLTRKAWSWMQEGFLLQKSATLTGSCLVQEIAYNTSTGEAPVGKSVGTTDTTVIMKN